MSPISVLNLWFDFSPPISDYDVFDEGKTQSFYQSQNAVMTLCTYLEDINKKLKDLSQNQLLEHFNKLLQVSNSNTTLIYTVFSYSFLKNMKPFVSLIITTEEENV